VPWLLHRPCEADLWVGLRQPLRERRAGSIQAVYLNASGLDEKFFSANKETRSRGTTMGVTFVECRDVTEHVHEISL
jgi:hypothetical protein